MSALGFSLLEMDNLVAGMMDALGDSDGRSAWARFVMTEDEPSGELSEFHQAVDESRAENGLPLRYGQGWQLDRYAAMYWTHRLGRLSMCDFLN